MLQRFVRSTVRTEPRPCLMVLVPWLWRPSSLWAGYRGREVLLDPLQELDVDGHEVFGAARAGDNP